AGDVACPNAPPCATCWPNGVPGRRMKAICLPSVDQTGDVSKSVLGVRYFMVRVAMSYTPIREWFSRVLTKASREPSGDQTGPLWRPHALMKGTPPVSIALLRPRAVLAR